MERKETISNRERDSVGRGENEAAVKNATKSSDCSAKTSLINYSRSGMVWGGIYKGCKSI